MDEAQPQLGEQQLEVLIYIQDRSPISANDVAKHFGETQGLARTTVLTVVEKLREKGYLHRQKTKGVWHYSAAVSKSDLLKRIAGRFIERTLGGSLFPILMYLVEKKDLAPEEIELLKARIDALEPPAETDKAE